MLLNSRVISVRRRGVLMGSTALFVAALAAPAHAQDVSIAPSSPADAGTIRISDDGDLGAYARPILEELADSPLARTGGAHPSLARERDRVQQALRAHPTGGLEAFSAITRVDPGQAEDSPSVTINNNFTPTQAFDPVNITGIGNMFVNGGPGSQPGTVLLGQCTGSLINRRTVIFAAHCVNTRPATAYGGNSGGTPIAFGFETNTRANAPGQPDELAMWLFPGPNTGRTNTAQSLYNANQVFYHPGSLAPASCTGPGSCFIEADVATAVLDTPTRNIPTWTMLFSPLSSPAAINPATGTGYHVTVAGYGAFGNGTTGASSQGNFRRRIAENMLGGLTSLNVRNTFIFGSPGTPSRPQLLYWLDFDDPRRGQSGANSRDFNGFRDNALTREGVTGPGDSGGPLIIDQAFGPDVRTIIGVLSGGSTFFNGQPGGSYGTQSFYQPLFLYWDWIVANNPYRYVTALGGNRNWEDPTTWITELDPAYRILVNGQIVNGLPTHLGGANQVTNPQFGELCFQSPSNSPNPSGNECENLATGQPRNNVPNNPSAQTPTSGPVITQVTDKEEDSDPAQGGAAAAEETAIAGRSGLDGAFETAQADPGFRDVVAPTPSLANGLPGATNFVANNIDGVRATGVAARYYDVTLRNAGILTLNSTVTIDNFTIAGAQSQLTVAAGGSLTSLVEVNQLTGIMNVNGTVTSVGDYFLMSGLLTGSGRVNAPFLTSVIGNFAPGTLGGLGTLTIGGNLIMSSGSTFVVDLANGFSDRLAVVANGSSTGSANVGGRVLFGRIPGTAVRFADVYTILTATGGVTGTFDSGSLSVILRPEFIYNANSVQVRISAVPYASVINSGSRVQSSYAALLDRNRGNSLLNGIYDNLDFAPDAATIQSTLEALAPRTETLKGAVAIAALDNQSRLIRDRIQGLRPGNLGGNVAYYGRRVETAALALSGLDGAGATMSDVSVQPDMAESRLPENMSAFLAAGYLEGESLPMRTALPFGGNDQFDGFYIAGGIEREVDATGAVGVALSYTSLDGSTVFGGQSVEGQLYQGTVYAKQEAGRLILDGQLSLGLLETATSRAGNLPGQQFTLRSESSAFAMAAEAGLGAMFGEGIRFGPRAALRASHIDFGRSSESGGPTALTIDRNDFNSFQGRAGAVVEGGGRIRPSFTATYVHEFQDRSAFVGANFVGGIGGNVTFDTAQQDDDWFEISGGLSMTTGRVELSVSADTTLDRDDVENQSYRAAIKFRF
jgi:hypothetical protein